MAERNEVCCCGARSWALVIGWIEAISCGLGYLICCVYFGYFLAFLVFTADFGKRLTPAASTLFYATLGFGIGAFFMSLGLTTAISLIAGVTQKNVKKVNIWIITHTAFMVIELLGLLTLMFLTGYIYWACDVLFILVDAFCIWVVMAHLEEMELEIEGWIPTA